MVRSFLYSLSLLTCLLLPVAVRAQDAKAPEGGAAITGLVRQLDAESFAERKAASEKLAGMGKAAVGAIGEAAQSPSAEMSTRALDILRKHTESPDAELKAAALEKLKELAANEKSSAARRAAEILKPKPAPTEPAGSAIVGRPRIRVVPGGFLPGPAEFVPLRAAIEIRAAAAGAAEMKRMTVRSADGVREVEVVEGDRKVNITDTPAKIKVKVTDKKDGKEEVKEYEAKNAEELKTKHPEGHKLYERYKGDGAIRVDAPVLEIGGRALPVPAFGVPAGIAVKAVPVGANLKEVAEDLEKTGKQLEEAAESLKKLTTAENEAEMKKAIQAIMQAKKDLGAIKEKVTP